MRHLVRIFAVLLLLGSAQFTLAAAFTGKVVGIADGDTISVMHGGKAEKIRLYGIDCPEKKQAFGQKAKQFTSQFCFAKNVSVQTITTDRYGRSIGVVILPDGSNLNQALVRNGYAWWYRQYAKHDKKLASLENEARRMRLGLWADPHAIPPWEFRRRK